MHVKCAVGDKCTTYVSRLYCVSRLYHEKKKIGIHMHETESMHVPSSGSL